MVVYEKRSRPVSLAPTGLPIVECVQRALRRRCTYDALIFRHQAASGLQLLIGQHSRAGRMLREYLKLLGRETAPVLRVLPGADNIKTGCLCWGMNKTFHCELLSVCGRNPVLPISARQSSTIQPGFDSPVDFVPLWEHTMN